MEIDKNLTNLAKHGRKLLLNENCKFFCISNLTRSRALKLKENYFEEFYTPLFKESLFKYRIEISKIKNA